MFTGEMVYTQSAYTSFNSRVKISIKCIQAFGKLRKNLNSNIKLGLSPTSECIFVTSKQNKFGIFPNEQINFCHKNKFVWLSDDDILVVTKFVS